MQKVIYDSGSGYELGILAEGCMDSKWSFVIIVTGNLPGKNCLPKKNVHPYSESLHNFYKKKYPYMQDKQFNN